MTDREFARRALIATGIVLLLAGTLYVLGHIAHMLLILFGGLLLAVVFDGGARAIRDRTGVSRRVAVFSLIGAVLAFLALVVWWAGPQFTEQFRQLGVVIPEAIQSLQERLRETDWGRRLLEGMEDSSPPIGDLIGGVTGFFSATIATLAHILIILFLCIYLAYEPTLYRDATLKLIPRERRDRWREVFAHAGASLRLWMLGQLGSMAVVGVLTGVALWIAGIPAAIALATIAAIFTFVPIIGPFLGAVPAVIVGLADGFGTALLVAAIYTGVEQIESYVATPLFQKTVVSLPPALVLGAQVVMGVLFGLVGIFLSTPLAIVAIVLVQMLYVEDVLGEDVRVLGES